LGAQALGPDPERAEPDPVEDTTPTATDTTRGTLTVPSPAWRSVIMANPVLIRLNGERESQVEFIDTLLGRVESEGRDLVDAERSNLSAARDRIREIDAQREPLEEFESLRTVSGESTRLAFGGGETRTSRPVGHSAPEVTYNSPGEYLVDLIRARGYPGVGLDPDPAARARVESALGRTIHGETRVVDKQLTDDTPGVLPKPVIGTVLGELDSARPFVASIGARSLVGVPGKTFSRPTITQHVDVGEQVGEKTQLPSRKMIIGSLDFTKKTYGGVVNVSRQDIDWTSPSAWDILLRDLANVYAAETDDAAAGAFATALTQTVEVGGASDLAAYTEALYAAAAMAATGNGTMRASALRLPNGIWASVDMWSKLGAMISAARITTGGTVPASSGVTSFASGDVLSLPQYIVPGLPTGTLIVGRTDGTEFYEERIGVLSAVEPAILGVEVAYGGYAAFGTPDPTVFAKVVDVTPPVVGTQSGGSGTSARRR
jgi:hypothetical protein